MLIMPLRKKSGPYIARAVTFDGPNDFLTRDAGLTGVSDSKLLTFSFWTKLAADDVVYNFLTGTTTLGGNTKRAHLLKAKNNTCDIEFKNSAGTAILRAESSINSLKAANGWQHVCGSFDLADKAKRHLYVDDVSGLNITTYIDDNMDFTLADYALGATPGGHSKLMADVADFYFAPGQYIDLSVEANRRKFITGSGKPVNLGPAGANPTGASPLVLFRGNGWTTNKGTGGGFTERGALGAAGTSPSD